MRTLVSALLFASFLTIPAARAADAPAWKMDPAKSSITFTARQMRSPAEGGFRKFTADIRFDPANLAGSKVTVVVDMTSAFAGNADVQKELQKELWFQVDKFPKATFEVTKFVSKGGNAYDAVARLTIRDKTKEVALPVTIAISGNTARATGEIKLNRLDFGVGRGEWTNTSIVAEDVTVRIAIEATRQ